MAKNRENQERLKYSSRNQEEREKALQETIAELEMFTKKMGVTDKKGKKIEKLIMSISGLDFKSKQLLQDAEKLKRGSQFDPIMDEILFGMEKVRREMVKLKIDEESPSTPQEDILEKKRQEEVQELEARAAAEKSEEFSENMALYNHAEATLLEINKYSENHDLEAGKEAATANFKADLTELRKLLDEYKYEDFKDKYQYFKANLDRLDSQLKQEQENKQKEEGISNEELEKFKTSLGVSENQPEPEKKKVAKKPKTVVVRTPIVTKITENTSSITSEQDKKEWENRDRELEKYEKDFVSLVHIIKGREGQFRGERKLVEKYDKDMSTLQEYLDTAKREINASNNLKNFDESISNLNKGLKDLVPKLEPDLKSLFENGSVLFPNRTEPKKIEPEEIIEQPTEKEPEAVVEQPVEPKKEEPVKKAKKEPRKKKTPKKEVEPIVEKSAEEKIILEPENQDVDIDVSDLQEPAPIKVSEEVYKERERELEEDPSWKTILGFLGETLKMTFTDQEWEEAEKQVEELSDLRIKVSKDIRSYTNEEFEEIMMTLGRLATKIISRLSEFKKRSSAKPEWPSDTSKWADEVMEQLANQSKPEPKESKKKGLWGRFKDAILHPDTKKVAKKVTYDTVTSVLGVKIFTDLVRWKVLGNDEVDLAQWRKGAKERGTIKEAYQTLIKAFEENKKNKTEEKSEKILEHLADLETKIKSADLSEDEKKALLDKLWLVSMQHQEGTKSVVKDRNKAVASALDIYLKEKVSGAKIVRDVMNFALTATGMAALRGAAYLGASVFERGGKAKKEFAKQTMGEGEKKAELGFIAKDIIVNSTWETVRAFFGQGEKKGAGGLRKAGDFVKALGTVARGFGIYGLAVSGTTVHQQVDNFLHQLKESQGASGAVNVVFNNLGQNAERVWHTYTHPTEIFSGNKKTEQPEIPTTQTHAPAVETHTAPVQVEAVPTFSVDQFAREHKLSAEFSNSLGNLIKAHPELNNADSVQHILDASQIGPDTHSHHSDILKGTIDTLDESGGERRQVIFEEILKAKDGGPQAAANYLQSQKFSSQHLSHLSGYIRKGTPEEFLKFAEKYNTKDARMVSGLFQAMQGRESTDLANARLQVDATGSSAAIDTHVRGKVSYFGLENGKPVLSGNGSVAVDQMGERPEVIQGVAHKPTDLERLLNEEVNEKTDLGAHKPKVTLEQILNEEVKGIPYVEKTVDTFKASESTPVVESAPAPVSKQVPETSAPKSAEVVKPEKASVVAETSVIESSPVGKFLKNHGSSYKEFYETLDKMKHGMGSRIDSSFVYAGDSFEFFDKKLHDVYDQTNLRQIEKILRAEQLYKEGKIEWIDELNKATMGKDDYKVMELAFAPHPNHDEKPFLANGGHAARIWDSRKEREIFWYEEDSTFTVKDGVLIRKSPDGEDVFTKEDIANMIQ